MPATVIGRSVERIEGRTKVTGEATYAADVKLPGMLYARVLRSPVPHARITSIDTSAARALPGVVCVLTAADLPPARFGRGVRDMPVLCGEVVRHVGDRVAAVAAESLDIAAEALTLIEVEHEELPAVFDPQEALEPGAPAVHPDFGSYKGATTLPEPRPANLHAHTRFDKGDIDAAFAESDLIFEDTFRVAPIYQGYLEPRACVVSIDGNGTVNVWVSNKSPFPTRSQLAQMTGVEESSIVVHPVAIGGEFGGKGQDVDEVMAYWLAKHSARPVKLVRLQVDEFQGANFRHGAVITVRTGVKRDGRLWARHVRCLYDSGAYASYRQGPDLALIGPTRAAGSYRIPHARTECLIVYTNNTPGGIMRAPGQPQANFAAESQIDIIARELGMDPLEFRLLNALEPGDELPMGPQGRAFGGGVPLKASACKETLELVRRSLGWGQPLPPGRGRGLAIGDRGMAAGECGVVVSVDADGQVKALLGVFDVGTGTHTIVRQVVADQLGLEPEQVQVVIGDTSTAPRDAGVGGSKHTYTAGTASLLACEELRQRLAQRVAARFECALEDVEYADGGFNIRGHPESRVELLEAAREAAAEEGGVIQTRGQGPTERPPLISFVAAGAEVEVDRETGQVTVHRLVGVLDVGQPMNPVLLEGQIRGGLIQGFGHGVIEEVQRSEGRLATLSLADYKLPNIADVPPLETPRPDTRGGLMPYGAKGVGELGVVPVAAALANAVAAACGARVFESPVTAERVLAALEQDETARSTV